MRIIAGRYGARVIGAPPNRLTHPMSEKMRGAIFSSLGDISGLSIVDAYSGSGALAIEAISRGAVAATALEADPKAALLIKTNARSLGADTQIDVVQSKVGSWAQAGTTLFDIILADPPYNKIDAGEVNLLARRLKPGSILVLSWPGKIVLPELETLELIKQKNYGDAQLGYYRG